MDLKLLPNNAMIFTENQHGSAILEKLNQQRELLRCCDVILHVDGKQFYAHRCVLSACSTFFDSMFKASKTVREQLHICGDSAEIFNSLLAYIYTGTVIVNDKNVDELLKLANKLLLCKLKEYCAEYLQRYLGIPNCLALLKIADKYCLESLQRITNNFIAAHLLDVIEGDEILELPIDTLEKFIRSEDWCMSPENIFSLITYWVYHNIAEREAYLRSLLTWISWKNINTDMVLDALYKHTLFTLSEKCRDFLLEVLIENDLLPQSTFERLKKSDITTNQDEANDKFFNLAISTAIGETVLCDSSVERLIMYTNKDLPKADFGLNEPNSREIQDRHLSKEYPCDLVSQKSDNLLSQAKNALVDCIVLHPNSGYSQTFDIDQCYTEETDLKKNQGLIECTFDDHEYSSNKLDPNSHLTEPQNCYHYRDSRENEKCSLQVAEKCPKMTNRLSYMNHKFGANYSNHLSTLNELNTQKNHKPSTDMFLDNLQTNFTKDRVIPSLDFTPANEHSNSIKQESQPQSLSLTTLNIGKKSIILVSEAESLTTNSKLVCLHSPFSVHSPTKEIQQPCKLSGNNSTLCDSVDKDKNDDINFRDKATLADAQLTENISLVRGERGRVDEQMNLRERASEECKETSEMEHCGSTLELMENIESSINIDRMATQRERHKKNRGKSKMETENRESSKLTKKTDEPNKKQRICNVCNSLFDRNKEYHSHMITHFPGPPHQCDTCDSAFKRIYHLLEHRHIHSEVKPYKCTECSFTSHRLSNVKEHANRHGNTRPFKCETCGDAFNQKQHLVTHRSKHSNNKPFICEKCGWRGKTKNLLLCHTKIHTGDVYSCQFPDCAYRTPKKSHLKEHMQYHSGSRPFSCKVCPLSFISKYHLARHTRKHDSPNQYQCSQCEFCSSRQDALKLHVERKHNTTKPKLRPRKKLLKKNDGLVSSRRDFNRVDTISASAEQMMNGSLCVSGPSLSPLKSTLPQLSASLGQYTSLSSPMSSCAFDTPSDRDEIAIVSELEDDNQSLPFHQASYLEPSIGQTFSGLLDVPCETGARLGLTSGEYLYYNEV